MYRRTCFCLCDVVGLILGVLAGVAAGLLFNAELLVGLVAVIPIVLGFGAAVLALLLVALTVAACRRGCACTECLAGSGTRLLVGALGTVVSTLLFLLFTTGTLFILQAVLVALVAFFFVYLLVQLACYVVCQTRRVTENG